MRTFGRISGFAAVIVVTHLAGGCRMIEQHLDLVLAPPVEEVARPVRPRKVARLVKPRPAAAGSTAREFCGRRHVEFQAGRLHERPDEAARNNELCRQLYSTDGPAQKG